MPVVLHLVDFDTTPVGGQVIIHGLPPPLSIQADGGPREAVGAAGPNHYHIYIDRVNMNS